MKRIVGYARVSTLEQAENSQALKQQINRLKSAGAAEVHSDKESGYKERDRPGLQKIMELVKSRQVDEVIVTRIDRVGRQSKKTLGIIDQFIEYGVTLRALDEPFDLGTAAGKMTAGLLSVFAQHHSDQKSESIRTGKFFIRSHKMPLSAPFGYLYGQKLAFDKRPWLSHLKTKKEKTKHKIAQEIIEIMIQKESLRSTIRFIFEKYGINVFTPPGLRLWLLSPVLRGHIHYKKPVYQIFYNQHPAIISEKQYLKIVKILEWNGKVRGYGSRTNFYLSGMIYCQKCGSRCHVKTFDRKVNGIARAFQCSKWPNRECDQKTTIRVEVVEAAIIKALQKKSKKLAISVETEASQELKPEPSSKLLELESQLEALLCLNENPAIQQAITQIEMQIQTEKQYHPKILNEDNQRKTELLQFVFSRSDF